MKVIAGAALGIIILSGCASTSGPTSNVGIINGKYAIQTTTPNNNKGKKVNLTGGQTYSCENSFLDKNGKQQKVSYDLKVSEDGNSIIWYNDKVNGATPEGYYIGKIVFKPGHGFVETTKGKQAFLFSKNNSGKMASFASVRDREKFMQLAKKWQNGKIIKSEYDNGIKNIKGTTAVCTQITNNTYTKTRYLTDHEISAYQQGQQIAVQQRAIDSANWNATMANIQAQNAQMNYNTQQMLNRTNTYNVNVVGY